MRAESLRAFTWVSWRRRYSTATCTTWCIASVCSYASSTCCRLSLSSTSTHESSSLWNVATPTDCRRHRATRHTLKSWLHRHRSPLAASRLSWLLSSASVSSFTLSLWPRTSSTPFRWPSSYLGYSAYVLVTHRPCAPVKGGKCLLKCFATHCFHLSSKFNDVSS